MNVVEQWQLAVEELSRRDSTIEEIISQYSGEKMALRGKPFETLCRSIVGQQISVKAADSVWTKVENLCNGNINKEKIINLSSEEMRSAGLSKQKITYLKNIATSDVLTTNWEELSDVEAIDRLCKIKGVGVWTAEMFLIFNLGRPDVLPLADIGLIRGIEKHYYNSERIDKKELEKFRAKWSPWCTVATWYLWRSLDPIPVEY
ncbi:MAG: DNA-3-methyladenine glycosylase [Candidatus Thermoplasmatota archaeon]|nr:DNA-3-methyladenine glycosylase [Candidatus Thermoplasmatota archaeon]